MSYSIYFNSFIPGEADKKWDNIDLVLKKGIALNKEKEELGKRLEKLDDYRLSDKEIYDPAYKEQAAQNRARREEAKKDIQKELKAVLGRQPISNYYIENQKPIEPDLVIDEMVRMDLDFGGRMASFSSAVDPIGVIETTLKILFPEIHMDEMSDLKEKDMVFLARHLDELKHRYGEHKEELLENETVEVDNERQLLDWLVDFRDYLIPLRQVALDVADKGALFYAWNDGINSPAEESLKKRAKEHIEKLKSHALFKIPLGNYTGKEQD